MYKIIELECFIKRHKPGLILITESLTPEWEEVPCISSYTSVASE